MLALQSFALQSSEMRFLKFTILAIFIAFSAACLLISGKNSKTKINPLTHHAQTLQKANAETVKGNFERENKFEAAGIKAEMSRVGADFFIKLERNGTAENYKIEAVVGAKTIQQYVARVDGKLVRLPLAFDLIRNRWTNLSQTFFEKDGADSSEYQKDWNVNCAACHLEKDAAETDFDLKSLNSETALLACGSCHARGLHEHFPAFDEIAAGKIKTGDLIASHQIAAQNSPPLASRQYQGIIRSVCFVQSKAGGKSQIEGEKINCLLCHSIENGEMNVKTDEKLQSPQACASCHQQFESPAIIAEHTKHAPLGAASNCFSCHLPEIVYGHLRFERTHEISVPNPELTVLKQIPNACNQCHVDKSVNWAITQTKTLWSGRFRDARISADKQFDYPEGIRGLLAGDAFIRALSANNLARHADFQWSAPYLRAAFENEKYPLVRYFLAGILPPTGSKFAHYNYSPPNSLSNTRFPPQNQEKTNDIAVFLLKKRKSEDFDSGE